MAINVFAGSRRIALLISGLWLIGWTLSLIRSDPYVSVTYSVADFGVPAKWVSGFGCETDDATYPITRTLPTAKREIGVTLCFRAAKASNGEMLIPYAPADRAGLYVLLGSEYSSPVIAYTKAVASTFALDERGISEANRLFESRQKEERLSAIKWLLGGLTFLWVFAFAVGWIVRGFFGVPFGKDFKAIRSTDAPAKGSDANIDGELDAYGAGVGEAASRNRPRRQPRL